MSRLPTVGGDDGSWGTVLNDYLAVEHNTDGTQKTLAVTKGGTGATDAASARTALGAASTANPTFTGAVDASAASVAVKTFIPRLPTAVTPSAGTATFDLTVNNHFTVTLSGDTTFAISGDSAGQAIKIRVIGNSHTVTWWSGITWSGGSAPTLTAGGKADWVILLRTGSSTYDGALAIPNL